MVVQSFYGRVELPQFDKANPSTLTVQLWSVGGGWCFDRLFAFGKRYALAPFFGAFVQYQKYSQDFNANPVNTIAFQPEIGLNQYLRFAPKSSWYYTLTVAAGSFLYQEQTLGYLRVAVGVQYVVK
jgi:hypothetical protein